MKNSERIYRTIRKETALDDKALTLLGMSQAKIEAGLQQLKNAGYSDAKAEATILELWSKAKEGLNLRDNPPTA